MSVSVEKQAILMSLEPLFDDAVAKKLWFFHESNEAGELWCSPDYLRLQQSKGELIWAPEHWELRSPTGYLKSLRVQVERLVVEFNDLAGQLDDGTRLKLAEKAVS